MKSFCKLFGFDNMGICIMNPLGVADAHYTSSNKTKLGLNLTLNLNPFIIGGKAIRRRQSNPHSGRRRKR